MEEKAELRRQMVASLSEQRAELQQEARAELDARVREVEERLTPRDAVTSAQCDALQERLAAMRAAELLTEPELHTLEDLLVRDGVSRIALLPAPCLPYLHAYLSVYCLHACTLRLRVANIRTSVGNRLTLSRSHFVSCCRRLTTWSSSSRLECSRRRLCTRLMRRASSSCWPVSPRASERTALLRGRRGGSSWRDLAGPI
jgi:hypothetical protein